MDSIARVRGVRVWLFLVTCGAGVWASVVLGQPQSQSNDRGPQPLEVTLRDDAALSAACFVSVAEGWAVGERGVIWHTRDGGAAWEPQESHVNCQLSDVCFVDSARGWAVGGSHKPFSSATAGVVLQTSDGGKNWTRLRGADPLPYVRGVRFFDAQLGVAYGATSAMYPSGVYQTRDAGRSWQPAAADGTGQWTAGDFLDPAGGALAGPGGRFASLMRGEVKQSALTAGSLRGLHAVKFAGAAAGWAVGDGGFVALTTDVGRTWRSPEGDLPEVVNENFDFNAVAVRGDQVWIAGSPGTFVFHSPNGGRTWEAFQTGQTVPLKAISFVDERRGWAVGELGTILSTHDGGRSWQVQRSGGRRAALLAVFARASDVPLEVVAQQGAAEGYLTAIDVLFRPAVASAGTEQRAAETFAPGRTRYAMLLAGATAAETAWRFPLPPDDLALGSKAMMESLNRANDGRAAERLLGTLVRQLRMWRPDVVLTQVPPPRVQDSLAAYVQQLVLRAVDGAADPQQFPELASCGLAPWKVKRIVGVLAPGARGQETVASGQFVPQFGVTLADWSAPARRLLSPTHALPPDTFELAMLSAGGEESAAGRGLFRGISLAPGDEARRRIASLPAGDVDQLQKLAARRRNLEELMQRKAGDAAWAAQVVQLTEGMPETGGGDLVFQLADGYRTNGRLDLAADTYYLLARRFPEHPLTEQSLRWLVQYYASSEAGARMSGRRAEFDSRQEFVRKGENREATPVADGVKQASATAPIRGETPPAVGLSLEERMRRAVELGKYLEAARPQLYAEPAVRFPLVAAERQLGFANSAKRYFLTLRPLPENDPWRRCAITEEWLAEPRDLPPKKALGRCRQAAERPHLDGVLDEAIWQGTELLRLRGAEAGGAPIAAAASEPPAAAVVRLAYDAENLYIAVRCPKAAGGDYATDDRPRTHDADLTTHDRVAIRLDFDRDYTSHIELTLDHRGWTRDENLGDVSWNPAWYVAAAADETSWTVEAVVPLAELVEKPPESRHVWAVGARRTIPRVGYESWSGNAEDGDSPEQFGLLIFD